MKTCATTVKDEAGRELNAAIRTPQGAAARNDQSRRPVTGAVQEAVQEAPLASHRDDSAAVRDRWRPSAGHGHEVRGEQDGAERGAGAALKPDFVLRILYAQLNGFTAPERCGAISSAISNCAEERMSLDGQCWRARSGGRQLHRQGVCTRIFESAKHAERRETGGRDLELRSDEWTQPRLSDGRRGLTPEGLRAARSRGSSSQAPA